MIGAGGVKSPLLLYLAASGVGHIRVIDHDMVELSNLNRQILYRSSDIGLNKAVAAARTLRELNADIVVEAVPERASTETYDNHLGGFDLVFEGGESARERKAFNRWAVRNSVRYVHASAQYNYAYVFTVTPGLGPCFQCIFRDLPDTHGGPVPILGPAAGVAGSVAAAEGLGMLIGLSPSLSDETFFYDGWTNSAVRLRNSRDPECDDCGRAEMLASAAINAELTSQRSEDE